MGLTANSTGIKAVDNGLNIKKTSDSDKVIALAGNPNVGKSTVFNALTGLNQHTGNWPGKTVANAQGICRSDGQNFIMVDIPGTYSLMAHSQEEEVARDFICFGGADAVVVVCDATCLERNMNLVLQTLEITQNVVVCVNLIDEADKKQIKIDFDKVSQRLGVPVVATSASRKKGLGELVKVMDKVSQEGTQSAYHARYTPTIEQAIEIIESAIKDKTSPISARWTALRLLEGDSSLIQKISEHTNCDIQNDSEIMLAVSQARQITEKAGLTQEKLKDAIVSCLVLNAEEICDGAIEFGDKNYTARDRKIDKWLTSRKTGIPVMILLLCVVFWLTITGANYPSQLLSQAFFWLEDRLVEFCVWLKIPHAVYDVLIFGVYRTLAWVVSVMLPPMAIFFPLFTLLEDLGYLPRIAFNLDHTFKKCNACGKQALTMAMGFGCNAAGIVGCRIIDSPRERLIAMITNNFVPCNGRFPTMISLITVFFTFSLYAPLRSLTGAVLLTAVILLGIIMTFAMSYFLSHTLLKGQPSSFALELPPYRKPQFLKILVRSIFDRTLFVLGRAITVSAPAGLVIWIFANVQLGGQTLLFHISEFLNPFAQLIGMDGVILLAFILGFPANEIVLPIAIMAYMANGALVPMDDIGALRTLLIDNGWTWVTAVNVILFSLMHWPCSTTMMTIKKETGNFKWTVIAFLLPTVIGFTVCFLFTSIVRIFM